MVRSVLVECPFFISAPSPPSIPHISFLSLRTRRVRTCAKCMLSITRHAKRATLHSRYDSPRSADKNCKTKNLLLGFVRVYNAWERSFPCEVYRDPTLSSPEKKERLVARDLWYPTTHHTLTSGRPPPCALSLQLRTLYAHVHSAGILFVNELGRTWKNR